MSEQLEEELYNYEPSTGVEEHHGTQDEPWLISYADMMTLLFGFFVLMYSFAASTPEAKEKMMKELSATMGQPYSTPMAAIAESVKKKVKEINLESQVDVVDSQNGIKIISKGTLFFDSASTSLNPKAQELMLEIAKVVLESAKEAHIVVEGHTDDSPMSTEMVPSNWELSALRAGTVVRIFEKEGIAREGLKAMGLADTQPLLPNRDENGVPIPQNQAENRRIVIHIRK